MRQVVRVLRECVGSLGPGPSMAGGIPTSPRGAPGVAWRLDQSMIVANENANDYVLPGVRAAEDGRTSTPLLISGYDAAGLSPNVVAHQA